MEKAEKNETKVSLGIYEPVGEDSETLVDPKAHKRRLCVTVVSI